MGVGEGRKASLKPRTGYVVEGRNLIFKGLHLGCSVKYSG